MLCIANYKTRPYTSYFILIILIKIIKKTLKRLNILNFQALESRVGYPSNRDITYENRDT